MPGVFSLEAKAGKQQAQGFVLNQLRWRQLSWDPKTPLEDYCAGLCELLQKVCRHWQVRSCGVMQGSQGKPDPVYSRLIKSDVICLGRFYAGE